MQPNTSNPHQVFMFLWSAFYGSKKYESHETHYIFKYPEEFLAGYKFIGRPKTPIFKSYNVDNGVENVDDRAIKITELLSGIFGVNSSAAVGVVSVTKVSVLSVVDWDETNTVEFSIAGSTVLAIDALMFSRVKDYQQTSGKWISVTGAALACSRSSYGNLGRSQKADSYWERRLKTSLPNYLHLTL
ncbi:hypothetical protein NQ318_005404 [Aromia moschata]|uniref:Uncharacterized protein n=1 Tax=Aromia moschata TaxID=1265417 RepID=A0AAV8YWX2_9CUCU|nr:hypothetical protein NQ318_005404 [Aromia moschata]